MRACVSWFRPCHETERSGQSTRPLVDRSSALADVHGRASAEIANVSSEITLLFGSAPNQSLGNFEIGPTVLACFLMFGFYEAAVRYLPTSAADKIRALSRPGMSGMSGVRQVVCTRPRSPACCASPDLPAFLRAADLPNSRDASWFVFSNRFTR